MAVYQCHINTGDIILKVAKNVRFGIKMVIVEVAINSLLQKTQVFPQKPK